MLTPSDYLQIEKLQEITKLIFHRTLKQLEHYLGLTSWLCQLIDHYVKRAATLQVCKMKLYQNLRAESISTGLKRPKEASRLFVENSTQDEIELFESLQEAFGND